jgi:hypothetical protein
LSGCNQSVIKTEKDRFVGTWKNINSTSNWTYIFFSNGTFADGFFQGNYEIKDEKLVMNYSEGMGITYNYSFSNNDKILTLTPLETTARILILTKQ